MPRTRRQPAILNFIYDISSRIFTLISFLSMVNLRISAGRIMRDWQRPARVNAAFPGISLDFAAD
jgi:hypothetical protein